MTIVTSRFGLEKDDGDTDPTMIREDKEVESMICPTDVLGHCKLRDDGRMLGIGLLIRGYRWIWFEWIAKNWIMRTLTNVSAKNVIEYLHLFITLKTPH